MRRHCTHGFSERSGLSAGELSTFNIIRRGIDARQRSIKFNLRVDVFSKDEVSTAHPDLVKGDLETSPML